MMVALLGILFPDVPSIEDFEFIDSNLGWAIGSDSSGIGGILKTTNGGETWEIEVGNLTSGLNALCIKNNYGWAVGGNGLILRTTNAGLTWVENDDQKLPSEYILEQNYPNPFNPSTTIKYQIPAQDRNDKLFVTRSGVEESFVTLKVYNILGREVATLVNKKQNPGNYQVEWNASNLPSGIYFYQLKAGDFTETKKMVLLR